jgi:hypothetical protein
MRVYTIHLPPLYGAPDADPIAIREGFNWAAFLFGFLWALINRLWWVALGVALIGTALGLAAPLLGLTEPQGVVITVAFMAVIGAMANDWQRARLELKGWREVAVIAATSAEAGLRRYMDLASLESPAPQNATEAAPGAQLPAPPPADGTAAPA